MKLTKEVIASLPVIDQAAAYMFDGLDLPVTFTVRQPTWPQAVALQRSPAFTAG
jgi:hypothetical protein